MPFIDKDCSLGESYQNKGQPDVAALVGKLVETVDGTITRVWSNEYFNDGCAPEDKYEECRIICRLNPRIVMVVTNVHITLSSEDEDNGDIISESLALEVIASNGICGWVNSWDVFLHAS